MKHIVRTVCAQFKLRAFGWSCRSLWLGGSTSEALFAFPGRAFPLDPIPLSLAWLACHWHGPAIWRISPDLHGPPTRFMA